MKSENFVFSIFLYTIIAVRIFLYLKPLPSPTIKGFRFHHWMFGLFLIWISFLLKILILYAVGLGLFADELTYILIKGKTHAHNYSKISIFGTIFVVAIVYFLRSELFYVFRNF